MANIVATRKKIDINHRPNHLSSIKFLGLLFKGFRLQSQPSDLDLRTIL